MKKTASFLLTTSFMLGINVPVVLSAVECGQVYPIFSSDQIPDHVISYQDESAPEWKKLWDQARKLYNQKKLGQAQVQYEILLASKDNIDQARWEYVTLLMCRKQWQRAGVELAMLLSLDPERPEYVLAQAEIALGRGDYGRAVKLYAPLYVKQCTIGGCTEDKAQILTGYITALEHIGRVAAVIPLMEQLARLRPDDLALQQRIADTAIKNGQPEKALTILSDLAKKSPDDIMILQSLARTYEEMGNSSKAAACWQQVVALDVGSREAHEQLITYYRGMGNRQMELKHVEMLLAIVPDNSTLLEQAARINVALDRPDKAVEYYNWLLSLQPDSKRIEKLKDQALHELAVKLLALIENTGSNLLWQDLVQVTDDRIGVYRKLADMLRTLGRGEALIQVLLVIHNETPGDRAVGDELVKLLDREGRGHILASSKDTDSIPATTVQR